MPLDDLGQPQIVDPYSPIPNHMFRPLRTLGYRRVGGKCPVTVILAHHDGPELGEPFKVAGRRPSLPSKSAGGSFRAWFCHSFQPAGWWLAPGIGLAGPSPAAAALP
jgi:hypothetical protein